MNIDFRYQSIEVDKEKKVVTSINIDFRSEKTQVIRKKFNWLTRCCLDGIIESFSRDIMHFFFSIDKILKLQDAVDSAGLTGHVKIL